MDCRMSPASSERSSKMQQTTIATGNGCNSDYRRKSFLFTEASPSIHGKMKTSLLVTAVATIVCSLLIGGCHAIKDKSTGISLPDKANGLPVFGVGVRTKGPIKVYSVGCYGPGNIKSKLGELSATKDKAKALDLLLSGTKAGPVTFLLNFNFKVGAEKVASSITDSISSRHSGSNDVATLKQLLCDGVSKKGSTVKGTTMQFDCSKGGVKVSLDGKNLGYLSSSGLGAAFSGVYLDGKSVSPALRESCVVNCCQP